MIVKLSITNVGGIKDKMDLSFIASKSDKKNIDSVCKLPDNIWINRIIGIIAGNAHGKTTIVDSIASIGSFIHLPLRKKNIPNINDLELSEYKDEYKEKIFQSVVDDFTSLDLIGCNKLNCNESSKIEIEMYIKTEKTATTGYYKYYLEYDKNYKSSGIIKESLSFKSKYKKAYSNLFDISNSFESEIGYKIAYEKNILNELSSNNINVDDYKRKIEYYKAFLHHYNDESSIICADNYVFPEFFIINMLEKNDNHNPLLQYMGLADDNIRDLYIEKDSSGKQKVLFKYDDFVLNYNEISTATQKLLAIAYSIVGTNKRNGVFLIDELDNSLNYEISSFLVSAFSKKIDSMSQMIFTTNNPDILNNLRRDQIYLLLKDKYEIEAINFYNFIDPISKRRVRKDYSFTKAYKRNIIENFPNEKLKEEILNNLNR